MKNNQESQDHDLIEEEECQERDRLAYTELLEDAEIVICEAFSKANNIGIELVDILEITERALEISLNINVEVGRGKLRWQK